MMTETQGKNIKNQEEFSVYGMTLIKSNLFRNQMATSPKTKSLSVLTFRLPNKQLGIIFCFRTKE